MNQSKHTNLGLGILIGGLAAALFLRHTPDEKDNLPELESTQVFEQDFSLDFEETPILSTEIDEFEALHPTDFDEQISRNSGAKLEGIKVVSTPERDLPLPEMFPAATTPDRSDSIAKVEPSVKASQQIEQLHEKTERELIPAQTVNARISGAAADFPLPKNMFTESFLREPSETDKTPRDLESKRDIMTEDKATSPVESRVLEASPSTKEDSISQPHKPAANVIIPRRVRLGEPVARQIGMGTSSLLSTNDTRTIGTNSTSRSQGDRATSTEVEIDQAKRDDEGFLSLDGLDPLPNSSQRD